MSHTVYVLPVSGGMFVNQLAILCLLADAEIKPDLVMGASGGNVAAYVGLASRWCRNEILSRCHDLSSSLFITPWLRIVPGWMSFPFYGSMYKKGEGSKLFQTWFTRAKAVETEIWTMAFNTDMFRGQLFCNRSSDESSFKLVKSNVHCCAHPLYLDGDPRAIYSASYASAAIPLLTEPQIINGDRHVDGGVIFSSPLTPLSGPLINHVQKSDKKLHLIYISPYHTQSYRPDQSAYNASIGAMIHSGLVHDQAVAVSLLSLVGCGVYEEHHENVTDVESLLSRNCHYVAIISPTVEQEVDKSDFTGHEVLQSVEKARVSCRIDMWLTSPDPIQVDSV